MADADLITLGELKAYAGINSTNQDVAFNTLIPMISKFVKTYCNRTFIDKNTTPVTEIVSGGSNHIYLSEAPLIQLVSFEVSKDFGKTYTALTEYTDYIFDIEEDRLTAVSNMNSIDFNIPPFVATLQNTPFTSNISPIFRKHPNGYKITYRAGFAEVPADLKLAIMDLVMYYAKNDMAVKSPRGPGSNTTAIEYITTTNLPAHIRRVLQNYILAR